MATSVCTPCFNAFKRFCCHLPEATSPSPPAALHSPVVDRLVLLIALLGGLIIASALIPRLRSARVGDLANAFVLVNTSAFLVTVLANNAGLVSWLSPSFSRDGFCVFGQDVELFELPLLQSHILCFYVDTITALVLAWLARRHLHMRGHARVSTAAAGVFAHGVAHLGLWVISRDGPIEEPAGYLVERSLASRLGTWAKLAAFFFFLLRSVSVTVVR